MNPESITIVVGGVRSTSRPMHHAEWAATLTLWALAALREGRTEDARGYLDLSASHSARAAEELLTGV